MTRREADRHQLQTKRDFPSTVFRRWIAIDGKWVKDKPGQPTVGARPLPKGPIRGEWTFEGLPHRVTLAGRVFERAKFSLPYPGVLAQYREARAHDSAHLFVLANGRFVVPHLDEANPDQGLLLEHAARDFLPLFKA
jgi:hypothetical protein